MTSTPTYNHSTNTTATVPTEPILVKTTEAPRKTQAQLDQELREKLAGIQGDGGDAGLELEDGKVKGIGRGVRENMFRYI